MSSASIIAFNSNNFLRITGVTSLEYHVLSNIIIQVTYLFSRFGFMPDRCLPKRTGFAFGDDGPPQYVHCTGGMFVLIPDNKATSPRNRDGTHRKPTVGTYLDYIIHQRQRSQSFGERSKDIVSPDSLPSQGELSEHMTMNGGHVMEDGKGIHSIHGRVGFLWAWNYMLNKKWRTSSTGDEHFQDKMLADFRAFCSNEENRLRDYWDTCRQKMLAESLTFGEELTDLWTIRSRLCSSCRCDSCIAFATFTYK